jgi:hypothetical protein
MGATLKVYTEDQGTCRDINTIRQSLVQFYVATVITAPGVLITVLCVFRPEIRLHILQSDATFKTANLAYREHRVLNKGHNSAEKIS